MGYVQKELFVVGLRRNKNWLLNRFVPNRLRDLKIVMICFYCYITTVMLFNVIIGFRTSGIVSFRQPKNRRSHQIYCLDSQLVHHTLFFVNHISIIVTFTLTLIVSILAFIFTTLHQLCVQGTNVSRLVLLDPYKIGIAPGEIGQLLDLRSFTPLIGLRTNETHYLYLESERLKIFCDDYVSIFYLYNLIYVASSLVTIYSMYNIVNQFGWNLSRKRAAKKMDELYMLRAHEMSELD